MVRVHFAAFALLAAALAGAAGRADDWPVWLGPTQDGISAETGWLKDWPAEGPPRLFDKRIGEGYSAVSVAEGHLVLFHRIRNEEVVESLDPLTGAGRWRFAYATDYVDSYGYNGGPRAAPILERRKGPGNRVFTLGPLGVLHALSLDTGRKLWRRDLESEFNLQKNFFGVGAAPILEAGLVIVNLGGTDPGSGFTFALSVEDGKLVWKSPTGGGAYAAGRCATIDGARQLFIFHRTGLTCFDPRDGREKWQFPWRAKPDESVNAATPLVIGDILFFSASYGTGSVALRVKRDSHEILWKDDRSVREKALEAHWSTPLHLEGHVYGFSGRHEPEASLTCLELKSGKVRWRWPSYLGRGSTIYADGHTIALGERGDLALLKLSPEGHQELRRVPQVLSYPAWTPPTLANGILYLRDEKRLLALDLRPGAPGTPTARQEPPR